MNQDSKIIDLGEDKILTCPKCELEIPHVTSLQTPRDPIKKGAIIVCSGCGSPSKIGDSDLVPMTREDFNALDFPTKQVIAMAITGVMKTLADEKKSRIIH